MDENPFHAHQPIADTARDYDPTMPQQDLLDRYGALLLDPRRAEVMAGQPPLRDTAYVADRLLLPAPARDSVVELIRHAAEEMGLATFV